VPSPQAAVKRPVAVTSVTLVQYLLGFLWLVITLYLLFISRSAEMKQGSDSAGAIRGLEIAAAIVAPGAVFGLIAAYALGKGKLWGWWLSLIINAAFAAILIYSMIDEGWDSPDMELVAFTLLSLLPVVLLFLPVVRQFYWRKPATVKSEKALS
jgi:hypothetical protein